MEFERLQRKNKVLPLTPLIDVVFILIVFFMLTTSFMKIESLELMLPSVGKKVALDRDEMARIFIQPDGTILFGGKTLEKEEMRKILKATFADNADQKVVVFSAPNVSMQRLVDVMDMVYMTGGKSLFVREWQLGGKTGAMAPSAPLPNVNVPVVPVATKGRRSE